MIQRHFEAVLGDDRSALAITTQVTILVAIV